jgi:hypothetical protein
VENTSNYGGSNREPPDPFGFKSIDFSFIAKSILYICVTVVTIFFVNSCQVDKQVIEQCEKSCSSNGNRMDSVSVFGCDCEQKQDPITSPWVAPKQKGD